MHARAHPAPDLRPQRSLPTLHTERLTLRPVAVSDLDAMHAYLSREDTCRYLLNEPLSREEVRAKLTECESRSTLGENGDFVRLAVVRNEDGTVVGDVMLNIVSVTSATVEIGWIFSPHARGRGYATEAARALLGYTFETLGAHRVIAHLHPDNTASSRLCERLGMRHEALHRADLWIKNGWEDTSVYAVLRQEWAG
ncbi:GNAT family N-acetyltransferase [Saccharomonospora xinjiangensis]|uniref:Acetyltransferase, ribosomal protein N-acetylase n=1 Tax=Saccharomonospora xinjiangensis XJ-54 TaxID=882086 RepID=I0V004_9PSEU|nr:GNAT family N-acetyltransferase [Saccharomonospora xinjiangensis]EID53457.1 acetyltransferase, ribosomal protein N-acetylase [Saccharomonospora xinjiangensis XJ-54]